MHIFRNEPFKLREGQDFWLNFLTLSVNPIVTDWSNIQENYALAYMPEIIYRVTFNTEISLSTVFLDGKGDNLFANVSYYDMFLFKLKSFF